jgi:hypothetical protein
MKFAYADPPYYKHGKRLYGKLHDEAKVWDKQQSHLDLIAKLYEEYPDGFALSCNPADLSWILAAYPNLRICVWTKTFHQILAITVQYAWEPVLLHGGRKDYKRKPMIRDWLSCARSMRKGLVGAKPLAFNSWILDLLNYQDGDILDDMFPGTNGMYEAITLRTLTTRDNVE